MSDWEQRNKAAGAELIAPGLLVLGAQMKRWLKAAAS